MQFEVNGQTYFLNFDPSEGRWFVYEPTKDGMLAVPVHGDEAPLVIPNAIQIGLPDVEKVN